MLFSLRSVFSKTGYRCDEGSSVQWIMALHKTVVAVLQSRQGWPGQLQYLNDDRHKIKRINDGKGGRPVLWAIADLIDVLDKEDAFNYPATHNKTNQGRIDWLFGETDWTPEEKRDLTEIKIPKENRMHTSYQHTYAQDVTKRDNYKQVSGSIWTDVPRRAITNHHMRVWLVGKEDLSTQKGDVL